MLDLESMGVSPRAALLQIGIAQFDINTGQIGNTLKVTIDLASSLHHGLEMNASTVAFWLSDKVTQEARDSVMAETHNDGKLGLPLRVALRQVSDFIKDNGIEYIHGNGSASDCVWLRSSFEACNMPAPFTFRDDVCFRTIKTLCRRAGIEYTLPADQDIPHDGLQDAIWQAKALHSMLNALGLAGKFDKVNNDAN